MRSFQACLKKMRTTSLSLKAQTWWSCRGSAREGVVLTVWEIAARPFVVSDTETLLRSLGLEGGRSRTPSQDRATASFCFLCPTLRFPWARTRRTSSVPGVLVSFTEEHRQWQGRGSSTENSEEAFCSQAESSLGIFVYNLEWLSW